MLNITNTMIVGLLFTVVSCAGLKDHRRYPISRGYEAKKAEPVKKTVIEKLEYCTEKYISQHGVSPKTSYVMCDAIYRPKS